MQNFQLIFDRPLFDWTGVAQTFFDMIFRRVGAAIPVSVGEFSSFASVKLNEMHARYSVYGGPSSVTLFADKLAIDFPNLAPSDIPLVGQLLKLTHDGFATEFTQVSYSRVDMQSASHLEVLPPDTVTEVLDRYQINNVKERFREAGAVVVPGIRFWARNSSPPWSYSLMVEHSLLNASALYANANTSLTDAKTLPTFEDKLGLIARIGGLALQALEAEVVDGIAT